MKKHYLMLGIYLLGFGYQTVGNGVVRASAGQLSCDSLYYLLQNLAINHVRANEVWVEHYLDCSSSSTDTMGAFILSTLGKDGQNDRVVFAQWFDRHGWKYRFGDRAPNLHFLRPSPRLDINGDGHPDFVFTITDPTRPTEIDYRIVLTRNGQRFKVPSVIPKKGLAIDSILPAPPPAGSPHPLQIIDRRAWEVGGLDAESAPVSYRYLVWSDKDGAPGYINRTKANQHLFPLMAKRKARFEALPQTGEITLVDEESYEEFLRTVIGYCLDQNNLGREYEGFKEADAVLNRARYQGSTRKLSAPRQVSTQLRRALPASRKVPYSQKKDQQKKDPQKKDKP